MRLSKTEHEIMEFFWGRQENQTFAGMLAYWNQERKKNWSKQTLNTYLRNLSAKGLVGRRKTIGKTQYFPLMTEIKYLQREAEEVLRETYDGKLGNFVAFLAGKNGSKDMEYQELLDFARMRLAKEKQS